MFLALALALAATDPTAAATPATPAAQAAPADDAAARKQKKEEDLDRVLCKREAEVGSNRPKKICMTVRDWRAAEDATQNMLNNLNARSEKTPGSPAE